MKSVSSVIHMEILFRLYIIVFIFCHVLRTKWSEAGTWEDCIPSQLFKGLKMQQTPESPLNGATDTPALVIIFLQQGSLMRGS